MQTRSNHFSEAIVIPLFTILVCAMVEESAQTPSNPVSELCLRKCGVALANASIPKLSMTRCYRECQKRETDCPDFSKDQLLEWTPNMVNVNFGQYTNSSSWYVNVSWTPMNDNYGNWTAILVRFVIQPFIRAKCVVCPTNQTFLRINISSYDYQHPDPIYVNILALPYHSDISDLLRVIPQKLSTPRPATTTATSKPTTKTETSKPTTKTTGCNNEYGDLVWYPNKVNAEFSRESDQISYVNISWSPLTDPTVTWKGYMLSYFLGDVPALAGYSLKSSCFKLSKNQTYFIVDSSRGWKNSYSSISVNVTAYPRPRLEVADMRYFPSPISRSPPVSTVKISPKLTVSDTLPSQQPTVKPDIVKIVFSSVGGLAAFLTVLIAVVWLCRRRKWLSSEETVETQKRFKYHAFIIYSMFDSQWVDTVLIPTLEERYGFKCCVHWKDFLPGKVYMESIVESVYNSFKIIAVVSSHFMSSNNCDFELQHAMTRLKDNRDDCLIVIKFDNAGIKRLPASIMNRSYIDFTRQTDRSTWESKLAEILKKAVVEDDSSSTVTTSTTSNNNRLSEGSSTPSEDRELTCLCQV